jgi:pimeloyl-ACP methyl ester carboxylesterase
MAGDVLAVMDAAGVEQAAYWGYSMGGMIGWQLGKMAAGRFAALILGGAGPFPFSSKSVPANIPTLRTYVELAIKEGTEALVAFKEKMGGPMTPAQRQRELAADPRALLAWQDASESWGVGLELLPGINIPCLVYAGDNDPEFPKAKLAAGRLPQGTFVPLPSLTHIQALAHSEAILPQVKTFLNGLSPL